MRTVFGEIKWESDFGKNIEITFSNIKTYIISAKNQRKSIRIHEESHIFCKEASDEKYQLVIRNQKIESAEFAVNKIFHLVNELSKDMKISDKMSNDKILQKESSLQDKLSQCEKLAKKIQSLLEIIPPEYPNKEKVVQKIMKTYVNHDHAKNARLVIGLKPLAREKKLSRI